MIKEKGTFSFFIFHITFSLINIQIKNYNVSSMANNLMICANATNALRLNESENLPNQKYILEGVFAELDKLNRNQRIYQKDEYLKHLQYLRNDIKKGEPLLGELDHPEDRFEVKLKEASHRVIDLWYDAQKNVVMGKIELLNTPNGKLAQSIVDQGIPLHISSRAAGTVNSDNTVSIQQIYTYDLVCKPGFAGAVLYRVDESVGDKTYSQDVRNFLSNSLKCESMNSAPQYGIVNENISVSEIKAPAILRKEAKELQINKQIELSEDMTKPILENTNPDSTVGKPLSVSGGGAATLGIPTANMGGTNEADKEDSSDKKEENEEKEEKKKTSDNDASEDKKEACPKCGKNPCECDDKDDDYKDDKDEDHKTNEGEDDDSDDKSDDDKDKDDDKSDDDSSSNDDNKDDDSKDDGVKIIDVTAEFEDGKTSDDMIKDVEAEYDDDKKEGDKDSDKDGDKDEDKDSDDEKEDDTSEAKDEDKPTDEDDKKAKEAEKLNDDAKKDIEEHKDKIFKKLDDLKAAIEKKSSDKKEAKCESIIMAQYPVSMMMNESNFAQFAGLSESQKNKVVAYLSDNNFATASQINENWSKGIDYVSPEPVWLKHAPETYKSLYEQAEPQVKQSIANMASYMIFENMNDVVNFWDNSGLAERNERKLINESFVNNMPKIANQQEQTSLPYSNEFIKQIADMASEYNTHRY